MGFVGVGRWVFLRCVSAALEHMVYNQDACGLLLWTKQVKGVWYSFALGVIVVAYISRVCGRRFCSHGGVWVRAICSSTVAVASTKLISSRVAVGVIAH